MLDYAHNEGAYLELKKFMSHIQARVKVGVISVPGDRRDEDLRKLGFYAAQIFDEIIIKHDGVRTKSNQQITDLLLSGMKEAKADIKIMVISKESEAVKYALDNVQNDSFIFVCANKVQDVIEQVSEALKYETESGTINSETELTHAMSDISNSFMTETSTNGSMHMEEAKKLV